MRSNCIRLESVKTWQSLINSLECKTKKKKKFLNYLDGLNFILFYELCLCVCQRIKKYLSHHLQSYMIPGGGGGVGA